MATSSSTAKPIKHVSVWQEQTYSFNKLKDSPIIDSMDRLNISEQPTELPSKLFGHCVENACDN